MDVKLTDERRQLAALNSDLVGRVIKFMAARQEIVRIAVRRRYDDVESAAWWGLMLAAQKYDMVRPFRTFAWGCMYNCILFEVRHRGHAVRVHHEAAKNPGTRSYALAGMAPPKEVLPYMKAKDDTGVRDFELREDTRTILKHLPSPLREALCEYYFEGRSTEDQASSVGVSKQAIVNRRNKALLMLRVMLRKNGAEIRT